MAYIDQSIKKSLAPKIKKVLKKYNVQGSIAIRDHSCLVVTLKKGKLAINSKEKSLFGPSDDINIKNFYQELTSAMKIKGWKDNTRIEEDYFDVTYYIKIKRIGYICLHKDAINLKLIGIDDWYRVVFEDINTNKFYGCTDKLYNNLHDILLSDITKDDITYFGDYFNCEPLGISVKNNVAVNFLY